MPPTHILGEPSLGLCGGSRPCSYMTARHLLSPSRAQSMEVALCGIGEAATVSGAQL